MFSLQPCDELVFAAPTTPQEYDQIPHNNIMDPSLLESNFISFSATREKQLNQSQDSGSRRQGQNGQSRYGCSSERRVKHREIERKRREEASNLYNSLRALLPPEQSKGRISVSDQMEEATNYIKHMHNKIQDLRSRRDNLKNESQKSSSSSSGTNTLENRVVINHVLDGLEILISNEGSAFEITEVVTQLSESELDVVGCVSTRTKDGFLHKIETKGNNMKSLDIWELQNRLKNAIN